MGTDSLYYIMDYSGNYYRPDKANSVFLFDKINHLRILTESILFAIFKTVFLKHCFKRRENGKSC